MLQSSHKLHSFDGSVTGFLNAFFEDWFTAPGTHRAAPSFHADMWFKPNFLKYLKPVHVLWYDPRWLPWEAQAAFFRHEETRHNLRLWWRTYCRGLDSVSFSGSLDLPSCERVMDASMASGTAMTNDAGANTRPRQGDKNLGRPRIRVKH